MKHLNYGYYIPVYLGFNDNITQYKELSRSYMQVGNCNFLNKTTYSNINPIYTT